VTTTLALAPLVGRPGSQRIPRLVSDLLQAQAFPHPARDVRLVETHISWVILAGSYAFKLKKPVAFGFLDYSTREQRRADCEAEVSLNRRLCPDLYLGVVDVVQRNGRFAIGPPGQPVEPAVWMRRLPDSGMLRALLARGAASEQLMVRLAQRLAAFHAAAPTGQGVDEQGSPASIGANWQENFQQVEPFIGRTLSLETRDAIRASVARFLAEHEPLLERRVADGRIRDGHGDLHVDSVCVAGRRMYLFDCIAFNQCFRCGDVAAEVAFLAMDLAHLGRADLASAFVDAYVRASADGELADVLAFYTCYRAFVRGKVLSFRLAEPHLDPAEAERIQGEASAYFDLAWANAGGLREPRLVVTMGLPASGKTTLARALAGRLGLVYLSSDVLRKRLAGLRPTEHRFEGYQRGLYSRASSQRTYALVRRRAARWLRRGRSVVLDATYGRAQQRAEIRRLARRMGVPLVFLVCQADEGVLRARLAARSHDPQTTSDARLELWPALRAAYSNPSDCPQAVAVDTSRGLAHAIGEALAVLRHDARWRQREGPHGFGKRLPD
jgi:uncharacterized protein